MHLLLGWSYRKSGDMVPTSTVHKILRNRIYSGDFDFDGAMYHGAYVPVVSRELWDQVQVVGLPGPRHGKHLTVVILALELRLTLDLQVLLGHEECLRVGGHR